MKTILPLGVNGFYPSFGRHTMCYFLRWDDTAILLDCGSGACRLGEEPAQKLLEDIDHLHVFLSHYHLDHLVGLSYLAGLWRRGPLTIYAPSQPLLPVDAHETLTNFLRQPYFSLSLNTFHVPTKIIPITETEFSIGGIKAKVWPQQHPGSSLGLCLDQSFAYVTDTPAKPKALEPIVGVDLLLHELWLTDQEAETREKEAGMHTTFQDLVERIEHNQVKSIMPIHHHPARNNDAVDKLTTALQHTAATQIITPKENQAYTF